MKRENNPPLGKIFAMILGAFLILVFVVFNSYKKALITPNSDKSETINFQIEEGISVDTILENLINSNLLERNNRFFTKAYLRFSKLGDKIQAGSYQIPQNLNIKELINTLQNGKEQDIWVTIPEGLRKDEIAELIEKELNKYESTDFSKEGFLELTENPEFISTLNLPIETSNLEGFLFPDKYALSPNSTTESVMNRLIKNFLNKVPSEITYEDLIMASIVEREGNNAEDRPVIAGILLKRIKEGWLIQADATLLYLPKDWKHIITIQDKESDNPYNSYKRAGLPPTPICNPGIEAINATLSPKESPYYYYIHDNDGIVRYATTLEQHTQNVAKYLR